MKALTTSSIGDVSMMSLKSIRHRAALAAVTLTVGLIGAPFSSVAAPGDSKVFNMKVSPGAAACLPGAYGRVTVSALGPVENMHVEVYKLKPNTTYDLFLIQVPNFPFGLSWYQGDITTNSTGFGVGDFVGRFSVETFIVAPGEATVPLKVHPADAPYGTTNPPIPQPIHTYHLGLWFDKPTDATAINCPGGTTPFNGDHTAGVQVLNTGGFADNNGPLRAFRP